MTGVLTIYFGNSLPVEGWSEALGEAHVRRWPNFSAAADEANLARIWAGIHFRTAVVDARAAGDAIGAYVIAHAAVPVHGKHGEHEGKRGKHNGHHSERNDCDSHYGGNRKIDHASLRLPSPCEGCCLVAAPPCFSKAVASRWSLWRFSFASAAFLFSASRCGNLPPWIWPPT